MINKVYSNNFLEPIWIVGTKYKAVFNKKGFEILELYKQRKIFVYCIEEENLAYKMSSFVNLKSKHIVCSLNTYNKSYTVKIHQTENKIFINVNGVTLKEIDKNFKDSNKKYFINSISFDAKKIIDIKKENENKNLKSIIPLMLFFAHNSNTLPTNYTEDISKEDILKSWSNNVKS